MSRTYRRTTKGQKRSWLPNIWKFRCDGEMMFPSQHPERNEAWLENNPHRIKDVGDHFRSYVPMHWWHDHHTVPARAKERALLRKVLKDEVDTENIVWPTSKKPIIYWD